jgi:protein-L-isoaspartate(D-aspartate) O-methyltransferase
MGLADKKKMLIEDLKEGGYLKGSGVIKAFEEVPREAFVSPDERDHAYTDQPLGIGYGQTISAPHMVAIMTELLEPERTDTVLEIGAGSGYQAAILSRLVKKVYSIELEKELAGLAKRNLKEAGYANVEVMQGDGSLGYPEGSPYNKIIVTCGTDRIYPAWEEQLSEGGILLAPVNAGLYQELIYVRKERGRLKKTRILSCSFVPLRH